MWAGVNNCLSFEPEHDKTSKMTCVPSEDSDQPGQYPLSLITKTCFMLLLFFNKEMAIIHLTFNYFTLSFVIM